MAFKSKNLHYEKQEPAFLKRLRAEHGGERQNFQVSRPKNPRLATNADDDDPAIVDEAGKSVSKEEYHAMLENPTGAMNDTVASPERQNDAVKPEAGKTRGDNGPSEVHENLKESKQQEIANSKPAQRKRKQGKVVGAEEQDDVGTEIQRDPPEAEKTKKPRKGKKVKLSFDEENDE